MSGEKLRLFVGVHTSAPPSLYSLAADLNGTFEDLGLPAERRAFLPHISLARARGNRPHRLDLATLTPPGAIHVPYEAIKLFESRLKPSGAEYIRRLDVPLRPRS